MAIVISGGTSNSDSNSISDSNSARSQFKRSRFVSMNPYEGIFPPPRRFSPYHAPAEPEREEVWDREEREEKREGEEEGEGEEAGGEGGGGVQQWVNQGQC